MTSAGGCGAVLARRPYLERNAMTDLRTKLRDDLDAALDYDRFKLWVDGFDDEDAIVGEPTNTRTCPLAKFLSDALDVPRGYAVDVSDTSVEILRWTGSTKEVLAEHVYDDGDAWVPPFIACIDSADADYVNVTDTLFALEEAVR